MPTTTSITPFIAIASILILFYLWIVIDHRRRFARMKREARDKYPSAEPRYNIEVGGRASGKTYRTKLWKDSQYPSCTPRNNRNH